LEPAEIDAPSSGNGPVNEIVEWFEMGAEVSKEVVPVKAEPQMEMYEDQFGDPEDNGEFREVTIPSVRDEIIPAALAADLQSKKPADRAAAVLELSELQSEDAFHQICASFDDSTIEVRSAAARALFDLHGDRAATFTRALRDASPERRRKIGAAIASSGLANEAVRNLTGESRDKTYDAFSLLFLMAKAGELQPLLRAIEDHPSVEVRLAVVKLLALCGQPDVLPSFRRMAVRGSLPPDVRSAIMEAIYQISSQSPMDAQPLS
jgi:HEAT repeat protein